MEALPEIALGIAHSAITLLGIGCLFMALECLFPCNPAKPLRRGMLTDVMYFFIVPLATRYIRIVLAALLATVVLYGDVNSEEAVGALYSGHGPLARLPVWLQSVMYLMISDIYLYFIHRQFHTKGWWKFHAIHHSSKDLDWLSANRFHPVNTWVSFTMVDLLMLLIGFSPTAIASIATLNMMYSAFVHSNLRWTLGPLRYVLASPVFHRWHHTMKEEGRDKNFAPTFPILDIIFGTYYHPKDVLPSHYGVDDPHFPEGFIGQLLYPFRRSG